MWSGAPEEPWLCKPFAFPPPVRIFKLEAVTLEVVPLKALLISVLVAVISIILINKWVCKSVLSPLIYLLIWSLVASKPSILLISSVEYIIFCTSIIPWTSLSLPIWIPKLFCISSTLLFKFSWICKLSAFSPFTNIFNCSPLALVSRWDFIVWSISALSSWVWK